MVTEKLLTSDYAVGERLATLRANYATEYIGLLIAARPSNVTTRTRYSRKAKSYALPNPIRN